MFIGNKIAPNDEVSVVPENKFLQNLKAKIVPKQEVIEETKHEEDS